MQLDEGRMVEQVLWAVWTVKSGVVWSVVTWMGTVPVRGPVWVGVKVICSVQVVAGASGLPGVGQVPVAV